MTRTTTIRNDDRGQLDEIWSEDVASVHLERMDEGAWFLLIEHPDGQRTAVSLASRKSSVTKVDAIVTERRASSRESDQ